MSIQGGSDEAFMRLLHQRFQNRIRREVELTGSSVFDYIHPADHVEMAERLGIRPHLRAEAGCQVTNESASSSASTPSLAGTPEPGPSSPLTPADEPLTC
ncbi:hypothetical protein AALO_G00204190 [Alosa alosa]|uniref:Uncharacterized protein n=1 Tax=Alosa alosa TaxID=278164 RepID=A0AAV6G7Z3_9TELE|nr:hypothetical protein AALO_G00204190 [Alosa alosa]